jgi:hypothetical protein
MGELKTHETARRTAEAGRGPYERATNATREMTQTASHVVSLGMDTMALWAQLSQRSLGELTKLVATTVQERARLCSEVQRVNVDVLRAMQTGLLRWQALWSAAPRDAMRWYQEMLEGALDGAQKIFSVTRKTPETVTWSFELRRESTEQATSQFAAKMEGVTVPEQPQTGIEGQDESETDQLRAADQGSLQGAPAEDVPPAGGSRSAGRSSTGGVGPERPGAVAVDEQRARLRERLGRRSG